METKENVQFSNIKMKNGGKGGEAWSGICHDLLFVLFDSEIVNYLPLKLIIKKRKVFPHFHFQSRTTGKLWSIFSFFFRKMKYLRSISHFLGENRLKLAVFLMKKQHF